MKLSGCFAFGWQAISFELLTWLGIRTLFFSSRLKLLDSSQLEVWELSIAVNTSSGPKAKSCKSTQAGFLFLNVLLGCSFFPPYDLSPGITILFPGTWLMFS